MNTTIQRTVPPAGSLKLPSWQHLPQLDGMRALAFFYVFLTHHWALADTRIFGAAAPGVNKLLGWGVIGVYLFFALSGYLITTLLLHERTTCGVISLRSFYARRALRLLPVFYLVLACAAITIMFAPTSLPERVSLILSTVLPVALGIGNFTLPLTVPLIASHPTELFTPVNCLILPLWSLCVEMQFYLVWGWAVSRIRNSATLLKLAISIFALSAVSSCFLQAVFCKPNDHLFWYCNTLPNLQFLFAGVILSLLFHRNPNLAHRLRCNSFWLGGASLVIIALIMYLIPPFIAAPTVLAPGMSVLALSLAGLLAFALVSPAAQGLLSNRLLVHAGKLSYATYLFHLAVLNLVGAWLSGPCRVSDASNIWLLKAGISLTATYVLARLSWKFVEAPFNSLAKSFAKGRY